MFYGKIKAEELCVDSRELASRLMSPENFSFFDDSRYIKLLSAASPSYVARRVCLNKTDSGIYIGDNIYTESKGFLRAANDCDECLIMCCTLGIAVDKLIVKESLTSVCDAFTTDAMADAMIEALCDRVERDICRELRTVPRFSPGYSDLPLSVGKELVDVLGAETRLGIKFTQSGMMVPRKSVSAIVCIKR